MDSETDSVRISLLLDVEHVDHTITVDIRKIEHLLNTVWYFFTSDKTERAKPAHVINILILLRGSLSTLLYHLDSCSLNFH